MMNKISGNFTDNNDNRNDDSDNNNAKKLIALDR